MFDIKYPRFEKDMILKAEMLESIRDYPIDLFDAQYQRHSDGILSGVLLTVEDGTTIVVSKGVIKYKERIYCLPQEERFCGKPLGTEQMIIVQFQEIKKDTTYTIYPAQIKIKEGITLEENEMELGRFILKEGAVLRTDYTDLTDMATLHNTINIINVKYSGICEATLSVEITHRFGVEMSKISLVDPVDICFTMQCMQYQVMQKVVIEQYVRYRLPTAAKGELNQRQLYDYLCMILEQTKNTPKRTGRMNQNNRRMMVD